jgi:site-specific DNA recombinase
MTVPNDRPTRALIYTRISRDDSGEGAANERQEADCRTLAGLRGWSVVGVEADISVSAYSGKRRPGWERVLAKVRAREVDVVLAWHMDRITRTVRELVVIADLCRETGVAIATVQGGEIDLSNDTGRMVATIIGAVAEAEVERKGARQKAANAQRRAQGKHRPSGWRRSLDAGVSPG